MARNPPNPVRLSVACYRTLLALYPRSHRRAYGRLMVQLFRDLCRDAYAQSGSAGLIRLWLRTSSDLVISASAAHLQAAEEILMTLNHGIKPMSWPKVMLVVVPGILVGINRLSFPLGWLAVIGVPLIAILALFMLVAQKRLPAWGLLALGLLTSAVLWQVGRLADQFLVRMGIVAFSGLGRQLLFNASIRSLLVALPLWTLVIVLVWKYRQAWRLPWWIPMLLGVVIVGGAVFKDTSALGTAGFMLLLVVLGLPLAQRHGSLASLFVVGAYSLWLFDSDYYSGPGLPDLRFYPLYAALLVWLFIAIAPLLLVRARSLRGRGIGLLAPLATVLVLRMAVPWIALGPGLPPARVWLGDALMSIFALLILALALVLYARTGGGEGTMAGIVEPLER